MVEQAGRRAEQAVRQSRAGRHSGQERQEV
jgi:hypothetical protein